MNVNEKLQIAAQEYVRRQNRTAHPDGETVRGRWYPSDSERCDCCGVRSPSRSYPWSLMLHCRTAKHVATRYGVSRSELLRAAKEIQS